ncbi:MAG: nuclease PIN [Crocinitomicaceae bacterium]|nr:nuclease PIN [Crocinitomicaceae bacterium]|tara:strand:+ start:142 stop:1002 length:861 start_codon:yes stop_codon:yes gene_type:complete
MSKRIERIIDAQSVNMGGNMIKQPLPHPSLERVGPFLLIHHWRDLLPGKQETNELGVGPHPHRGFSPVTCIYSGSLRHRDSLGTDHIVHAGGTQWMDSGAGIVHSERPSDELAEHGGLLEIIQFWINTPKSHKMDAPRYQPLPKKATPEWEENGWRIRLVQGEWNGRHSPIEAHHPMRIANLSCEKSGAIMHVPLPQDWVGVLYILSGNASFDGQAVTGHQMALVSPGDSHEIKLVCNDAVRVLLLTGAELHEPVFSQGPFVMNTFPEIQQAILDYHDGKMGRLTG